MMGVQLELFSEETKMLVKAHDTILKLKPENVTIESIGDYILKRMLQENVVTLF